MINIKGKGRLLGLFYTVIYTAKAVWLAFFNLYLDEQAYTGSQIGLINGFMQATIIVTVPLWGYLADKYGTIRMLSITLGTTAFMLFGMGYINDFSLMLGYVVVISFFLHPLAPLPDSLMVDFSKTYNYSSYGEKRMWGSIGWGVTTLIMGYIVMHVDLSIIFPVSGILMLSLIGILYVYSRGIPLKSKEEVKPREMINLLRETNLTPLFIIIMFYGIAIAPSFLFINLYFKEIGGSNALIGSVFTVQAFSEIPFFFYGTWVIRKYGIQKTMIFTMIVALIRLALYGFIEDPHIALWFGILQGVTLSLFLVTVVEYIHQNVPQRWRASGQSLIWCFHFGIGFSLGNIMVGYFKDRIGMPDVMKGASVFLIFITAATWYYFYKTKRGKAA